MSEENKVYVASSMANYPRTLKVMEYLEDCGFEISYDWAEPYRKSVEANREETPDEKANHAMKEIDAVKDSKALLLVLPGKRGAHVEFGCALGKGIPCVVLDETGGEDAIGFHKLPGVVYRTSLEGAEEALRHLLRMPTY